MVLISYIATGAINEMLLCQDKSALQVILVSGGTFDSFIALLQNTSVSEIFFMPPTLKKLVGHIALGLSVYPCVRTTFFLTFKRWMLVS